MLKKLMVFYSVILFMLFISPYAFVQEEEPEEEEQEPLKTRKVNMAFGPGGGHAHAPDEYTTVEMLVTFAKIYALMFMDLLG